MAIPVRVNTVATATWSATTGATFAAPAQNVTAGNTIIVAVGGMATAAQTVTGLTDTAGNTYTKVDHVFDATDQYREEIWYATNITGHATNVVTVTWSAAIAYRGIVAVQYSGLDPAGPLDTSAKGTAVAGSGTVTTGTLTTTKLDAVHLLIPRWGLLDTVTYPAGFSSNFSGNVQILIVERFRTSPYVGPYTITHTNTSIAKIALVVAFAAVQVVVPGTRPIVVASTDGRATSASSLTVAHTVPAGTDRFLLVLCNTSSTLSLTGTYGGSPLLFVSEVNLAGYRLWALYLLMPPVGTADVVLSVTGGTGTIAACVITLTNCNGATGFTTATATSTTPSVTLSSITEGLVIDIVAAAIAGITFTVGAGQTSLLEQDGLSGTAGRIAVSSEPGAASVTMSWTLSTSAQHHIGALTTYFDPVGSVAVITQAPIEVLNQPVLPSSQVTQYAVELLSEARPDPLVSQFVVETLALPTPLGRVSQIAIETLILPASPGRVSQITVETLQLNPETVTTGLGNLIWMGDGGGTIWIE